MTTYTFSEYGRAALASLNGQTYEPVHGRLTSSANGLVTKGLATRAETKYAYLYRLTPLGVKVRADIRMSSRKGSKATYSATV